MDAKPIFSKEILKINNVEATVNSICNKLQNDIHKILRRNGGIIGISGGIDSSVTLALTARALGSAKVKGIMLPEKDSSPASLELAKVLA